MTAGDRFKKWVDDFAVSIKVRLRGWMVSWLSLGFEAFFDILSKSAAPKLKPIIDKLEAETTIPPELKPLFDELKGPTGQWAAALAGSAGNALIGGALARVIDYILRPLTLGLSYAPAFFIHDAPVLISLWLRGLITDTYLSQHLHWHGMSDEAIEQLKKVAQVIPSAGDVVRFAVREVYSPEVTEKFRQFEDYPTEAEKDAYIAGLSPEVLKKYWAAHWDLPSTMQGFEMLHRGILTKDELNLLLRTLDVMPYWRDQLIKLSWNIPTRVDARRFWDMRTIDEARLREIYTGLGYHAQDLEDYVLWTKIFVDFPDLLARYKNGWITLEQVKAELIAMGMKPDRADTMIEEKIKKAAPERVAKERDLTAAEIIKGIKKGVITDVEGAGLLQDMGYSADEAWFKIAIDVAASTGSPDNFMEFKDLTQKWRKAVGMEGKPVTEELKKQAAEVVRISAEVDSLKRSVEEEKRGLVEEEALPEAATSKLKKLRVTLHRAEATLAHAKSEYDRLVAEWKHGVSE